MGLTCQAGKKIVTSWKRALTQSTCFFVFAEPLDMHYLSRKRRRESVFGIGFAWIYPIAIV